MIGADNLGRIAVKTAGEVAQIPRTEADIGLRVIEIVKGIVCAVLAELMGNPFGGIGHQLHQPACAQPAFRFGVIARFAEDDRGDERGVKLLSIGVGGNRVGVVERMLARVRRLLPPAACVPPDGRGRFS